MRRLILPIMAAVLLAGCGENPFRPVFRQADGIFKNPPLDPQNVSYIIPLGNLNPPRHTLPTDHMYFVLPDIRGMYPVYAPASGVVTGITSFGNDYKVSVLMTNTCVYYLGHLLLEPGVREGKSVSAGQKIGTTSGYAAALDFGIVNAAVTLGFANPGRYVGETLHADSPLKYYEEPVRGELYAKVQRTGGDRDGKINYDVPGRLSGSWFLDGYSVSDPDGGKKAICFAYDTYDPSSVRISIGGEIMSGWGVYGIQPGAPDPAGVSPADGKIRYQLYPPGYTFAQQGLLIVQMLNESTLKAEFFPAAISDADFTSNARTYAR